MAQNKSKKKPFKVTDETMVRIYSNSSHDIILPIENQRTNRGHFVLKPKQFVEITAEDLKYLLWDARVLFDKGFVFIASKPIREHFDLDYTNILAIKDYPEVLNATNDVMIEKIKRLTKHLKYEFALYAGKQVDSLPRKKVNDIRDAIGIDLYAFY